MPDFPTRVGATPAEVWGYATRGLSSDAANVIRDAILSDATKIAGGNIDATMSSRAAPTDILVDPVTDKIDGSQIDVSVASRAPSGEYNTQLDANISTRASATDWTTARADKVDKIQDFLEEATGTLTATGAEDTIKEITATVNKLHCFIDLTNMAAADSITVRQYMTIKAAGSPIKYAEEVYSDVQSLPMLYIVTKPARHGVKITLEQTNASYKDFDWETFQEKAA